MTKRRVLIVDDSAYNRTTLSKLISGDAAFEVVGTASDGEEALHKCLSLRPDLMTLDLEMPRMDGFTFLRIIMQKLPLPIVVVSSQASAENVFRALELGALDFIPKPTAGISERLHEIGAELLLKLHAAGRSRPKVMALEDPRSKEPVAVKPVAPREVHGLVVIGASTGGPSALQRILTELPMLPISIVIAQHMPKGFTRAFADRLNRYSAYEVREAQGGESLQAGTAWIAPGAMNLAVFRNSSGTFLQVEKATGERYIPSVDRLFASAAAGEHDGLLGIVLTGMGDDGAEGARQLKSAGGFLYVESEETAIVNGMPAEAAKAAGAHRILPLGEMARSIEGWAKKLASKDSSELKRL